MTLVIFQSRWLKFPWIRTKCIPGVGLVSRPTHALLICTYAGCSLLVALLAGGPDWNLGKFRLKFLKWPLTLTYVARYTQIIICTNISNLDWNELELGLLCSPIMHKVETMCSQCSRPSLVWIAWYQCPFGLHFEENQVLIVPDTLRSQGSVSPTEH